MAALPIEAAGDVVVVLVEVETVRTTEDVTEDVLEATDEDEDDVGSARNLATRVTT